MRAVLLKWLLASFVMGLVTACGPGVTSYSSAGFARVQSAGLQEYLIHSGDQLDIKFFYNPELNEQIVVRPDGKITLQLVNDVTAAGLTPAQLNDQLKKVYSAELKKPEVAVIVRTFSDQRVYVDGEVAKPGVVPLPGPMTVLQSISQAGGMKESAYPKEVIIIRKSPEGKSTTIVVNLQEAVDGTDLMQDVDLSPYDIVFVPRSAIANVNVWVDRYLRRNIPVPIGLGASIH